MIKDAFKNQEEKRWVIQLIVVLDGHLEKSKVGIKFHILYQNKFLYRKKKIMGLKISWSEECLSIHDTKCRSTEKNIGQFDLEKNLPGKNMIKVKKNK